MSLDPFAAAREQVSALEVAQRYGVQIDRHGRALCPFHPDHRPSMTFKGGRYRCWVCNSSGDATDLVKHLCGGTYWEALKRLDQDFALNLPLGGGKPTPQQQAEARERQRTKELHQRYETWRATTLTQIDRAIRVGNTASWDNLTPQQAESIKQRAQLEYWGDTLSHGTPQQQLQLFRQRKKVLSLTSSISGR